MENIQLKLNWLSQCVFKASFCWQQLSFLRLSLARKFSEQFIQAIRWKEVARFQFNSWGCSRQSCFPAMVAMYVPHHVMQMYWMSTGTMIQTKGASGSRHHYLLSNTNYSGNCPPSDEYPPGPYLSSCQRHSETVRFHCHGFFSLYAWDCTATSSFLHTCGLSYPLSSNSHKIQQGVSFSLSSQSPLVHFAWLQLLATNSHCEFECECEHGYDFSLSSILYFLGVETSPRLSA